jgi:hypothetical protein
MRPLDGIGSEVDSHGLLAQGQIPLGLGLHWPCEPLNAAKVYTSPRSDTLRNSKSAAQVAVDCSHRA